MQDKHQSRKIIEKNGIKEVSGILLKSPDTKELVRIAKQSVPIIEMRLNGEPRVNGSSFMYKQVIYPEQEISRCYFFTNLHVISDVLNWSNLLFDARKKGQNIDKINLDFVIKWNGQECPIKRFIIPRKTLLNFHNNDPTVRHLDFAMFHLDIATTDILEFFGLPSEPTFDIGDNLYAFGYPKGLDFSLANGILSQKYDQEKEAGELTVYKWSIQHNILINHGNSGGPTVKENGEIVGISTYGFSQSVAIGLNFSLNLRKILEFTKDKNNLEVIDLNRYLDNIKQAIG